MLLGTRNPDVYELNQVGAWLWSQIETGRTLDELAPEVARQFNIDVETARNDCSEFFDDLCRLGFVVTS